MWHAVVCVFRLGNKRIAVIPMVQDDVANLLLSSSHAERETKKVATDIYELCSYQSVCQRLHWEAVCS